jgi:hypothetical protein
MVFSTHLDEFYDTRMDSLAQTLWFGGLVAHFFMAIPDLALGFQMFQGLASCDAQGAEGRWILTF